ncbi:hypothetical protein GYMLUDRAFT_68922 [Collybiopsis luxurians FD-317 M1]|nr:hypothetical protein GYMLUDRAFT_68922 [Collybiopsis luxurians FD-317 M1]
MVFHALKLNLHPSPLLRGMYCHTLPHEPPSQNLGIPTNYVRNQPRPLPRPPVTKKPRLRTSRSLPPRPLPPPPPPPKSPKHQPLNLKVSLPALSISPFTLEFSSLTHSHLGLQKQSPVSSYLRHRHPSILWTLDTSSDILSRPASAPSSTTVSPVSSFMLEAPTPRTARRKRISKLQRHLGEIIPQELVPLSAAPTFQRNDHKRGLSQPNTLSVWKAEEGRGRLLMRRSPSPAAIIAARLKEFEEEHAPSSEDSADSNEEDLWDPAIMLYGKTRNSSRTNDRQWIWEKAGKRWEEDNPNDIVNALRTL